MRPLFLLSLFLPVVGHASSIAMQSLSIADLLRNWEAQKGNHAQEILLAKIDRDALAATELDVPMRTSKEDAIREVGATTLSTHIEGGVRGLKNWGAPITPAALKEIRENREALKKAFTGTEREKAVWAWFLHQLGENVEAKTILDSRYAAETKNVLELQQAVYGNGSGPFSEVDYLLGALRAVSPPSEMAKHDEAMRKMKVHVSTLPQSMITT